MSNAFLTLERLLGRRAIKCPNRVRGLSVTQLGGFRHQLASIRGILKAFQNVNVAVTVEANKRNWRTGN